MEMTQELVENGQECGFCCFMGHPGSVPGPLSIWFTCARGGRLGKIGNMALLIPLLGEGFFPTIAYLFFTMASKPKPGAL